LNKKRD